MKSRFFNRDFFYLSDMEFKIEKRKNYTQVQVLSDKLDMHLAPSLKAEVVLITGGGEKNIVLDLSNCEDADIEGLNAIVTTNRLCKNSEGYLVVGGVKDKIEHLLSISQLDKNLHIAYNINKAEALITSLSKELK